jgi:hypothetical protein
MSGVSRWHRANHQVMFPSLDFYPWLATHPYPLYMCSLAHLELPSTAEHTTHIYGLWERFEGIQDYFVESVLSGGYFVGRLLEVYSV